jgi:MFS family permease
MLPRGLSALRERNLALLVASTTISQLGSGISLVALAFAVLRIGNSSDLGFVLLAREVPSIAFLLLGGVWADRVSRKWLLVGGDALSGGAQALTAALLLLHLATVWHVAVLQGVFGVALAFTRPATTGLVPDAVSSARLQEANAFLDLSRSSMRIAGPAAGALIVVAANPGWALAIDAATFIVSALLRVRLRVVRGAERPVKPSMLGDLRDGWREFVARTWVWVMVGTFGLFQLTLFPAFLVLGPAIAQDHLGGASAWGAILAVQAGGSVVEASRRSGSRLAVRSS